MDVFEAIERRHSYRGAYTREAVPREDLSRIVDAGLRAPSGYNGQSTSFVIVDEAETIAEIGAILGNERLQGAPALIVVVMDPEATADKEFGFGIEDYAAAVENVLLAVTALGYASVWIDGVLRREGRAERIAALLGVPAARAVRVVLPVGRPVEEGRQAAKKPFAERAWFGRFGGE